jgi:hypothetical protein
LGYLILHGRMMLTLSARDTDRWHMTSVPKLPEP